MNCNDIAVGAAASRSVTVTRELTVAHFHPDMPEVYGTPMMIYLMEVAAAEAIQEYLPEGWVSVGAAVNIQHLAPTPVGAEVTVEARVVSTGNKTVEFSVRAHDGFEEIGKGLHTRAAVPLETIEARAGRKQSSVLS